MSLSLSPLRVGTAPTPFVENDSSFPEREGSEEDCRNDDESVGAVAMVEPDCGEGDGGAHVEHEADHHPQRRPREHVHAGPTAAVGRASSPQLPLLKHSFPYSNT